MVRSYLKVNGGNNILPLWKRQVKSAQEHSMRQFYNITHSEMDTFLRNRGFTPISLPKVKECVYGKIIYKGVCVRVYTGIVGEDSRECGSDAIRVVAVTKWRDGSIHACSDTQSKVYRLENWKANLTLRIDNVIDMYLAQMQARQKAVV